MIVWDTHELLADTLDLELLSTDRLREESMTRYREVSPRIVSIIVLAKHPDGEHTDRDDLSLCITDPDRLTDLVPTEYDKKGNNRQYKIPKSNDNRTRCHDEKIGSDSCTSREEYAESDEYSRHTEYIDNLSLAIVLEIVLRILSVEWYILADCPDPLLHGPFHEYSDDLDEDHREYDRYDHSISVPEIHYSIDEDIHFTTLFGFTLFAKGSGDILYEKK